MKKSKKDIKGDSKKQLHQSFINNHAFWKMSPHMIDALACLGKKYYPSVSVLLLLMSMSTKEGLVLFNQSEIASLLNMNRRKVHKSLQYIIKYGYAAGATLHRSTIDSALINPHLLWIYGDNENKNPINKYLHFPTSTFLSTRESSKDYSDIRKCRKKSIGKILLSNITYKDIDRNRIDYKGRHIHHSQNHLSHNFTKQRNVEANFFYYVHFLPMSHICKTTAYFIARHINPVTYVIAKDNHALYNMMHKEYVSVGYNTIASTVKYLKDQGLIKKAIVDSSNGKAAKAIIVSPKLVAQSKHHAVTLHHKDVNKLNKLLNKRISKK